MKEFELVPLNLKDYKLGITDDLMYQIKGNAKLIKNIIHDKILDNYGFLFSTEDIKKLDIYVVKNEINITELWLNFCEDEELYLITKEPDLEIDDINKIKDIIINWLLG